MPVKDQTRGKPWPATGSVGCYRIGADMCLAYVFAVAECAA